MTRGVLATKNTKSTKAMKPSGVAWLGDIPEGWEVLLAKAILRNITIKNHPEARVLSLYRELGVLPKDSRDDNHNVTSEDTAQYKFVRIGNVVINKMKAWQGSIGVSAYDGIVSPAYYVCEFKGDGQSEGYIHYLLRNKRLAQEFERLSTGMRVGQWDLGIDDFLRVRMPLPPLPEQRAIADYLDEKCGAIDAAIAEAKKGIEEYKAWKKSLIFEAVTGKRRVGAFNAEKREAEKIKPSGIPWIGAIPEGWAMIKASKIFSVITDFVASGSFADLRENVKYLDYPDYAQLIRTADVSGKSHELKAVYISKESYDFLSGSNLYGGELLLPNIGASVGDVYIVPKLYERMSLAPNAIMVKNSSCDKFYFYFFSCDSGRLALEDIAESTAQPKFNKTDFRNLRLPAPPTEEQQAIADYLDGKCAAIDAMVAEKEALIADLEAYKKSLIYEVVTGKKEPEAAASGTGQEVA